MLLLLLFYFYATKMISDKKNRSKRQNKEMKNEGHILNNVNIYKVIKMQLYCHL